MSEDLPVRLSDRRRLVIPGDELRERASRSGGPGGQNVNKTSSKVSLRWDVAGSRVLGPAWRRRLHERLGSRLTRTGALVVHAEESRSQARNRERARERMAELVREALRPVRPRVPTRPTRASRERKLTAKRHRSRVKRQRGRVRPEDG